MVVRALPRCVRLIFEAQVPIVQLAFIWHLAVLEFDASHLYLCLSLSLKILTVDLLSYSLVASVR